LKILGKHRPVQQAVDTAPGLVTVADMYHGIPWQQHIAGFRTKGKRFSIDDYTATADFVALHDEVATNHRNCPGSFCKLLPMAGKQSGHIRDILVQHAITIQHFEEKYKQASIVMSLKTCYYDCIINPKGSKYYDK
jgi:hypothetical protein